MKDYYKIFGVLPEAEDIVIRAAYKALAQRYHPDRWSGSTVEANQKMLEINEAYSVLSDPIKKAEYDGIIKNDEYKLDEGSNNDADIGITALMPDWNIAIEYYP